MGYIPNTQQPTYQTERQRRRSQEQRVKKIVKKYGEILDLPTEEDMQNYINEMTKQQQLWQKQEENPQN